MFGRLSTLVATVALVFGLSMFSGFANANCDGTSQQNFQEVYNVVKGDYGGCITTPVYAADSIYPGATAVEFIPISKLKVMVIIMGINEEGESEFGGTHDRPSIIDVMLI